MDTLRVDICHRPLRIAWVIKSGDIEAFRRAVELSYTLWGGRFNPIVIADHEEEALCLVDLYRADLLLPIGTSEEVKKFPKKFPHLINPFFHNSIYIEEANGQKHLQLLDMHNALVHLHDKPDRKAINDKGVRIYSWQAGDPLSDVFLTQFGSYPSADELGIDYHEMLKKSFDVVECGLDPALPVRADTLDHPSIAYLSRYALNRHHSVPGGWDSPGFFFGDAANVEDLVCHWNLRAADIALWFVDPAHPGRYTDIIPACEKTARQAAGHRHKSERGVAVWTRYEDIDQARQHFDGMEFSICPVSEHIWNGRNVRPPMMSFDQFSVLGVSGRERSRPKISFSLSEKPFCQHTWFHTQHLVASVSFIAEFYGNEQYTLTPPYIPELNEFYARTMLFHYDKLRIEPERIGIVINVTDTMLGCMLFP